MIRTSIITIIGVALSLTAVADEFYLKHDKSEKVYGPFDAKLGSKIVIGSTTFTVVEKPEPPATPEEVKKKLESITIPVVYFRAVTMEDAVEFIEKQLAELDPEKTGVKIIFERPVSEEERREKELFKNIKGYVEQDTRPTFNLRMRKVVAADLLQKVTHMNGYRYEIKGPNVVILPAEE